MEGDVNQVVVDGTGLTGAGGAVVVEEVRYMC